MINLFLGNIRNIFLTVVALTIAIMAFIIHSLSSQLEAEKLRAVSIQLEHEKKLDDILIREVQRVALANAELDKLRSDFEKRTDRAVEDTKSTISQNTVASRDATRVIVKTVPATSLSRESQDVLAQLSKTLDESY